MSDITPKEMLLVISERMESLKADNSRLDAKVKCLEADNKLLKAKVKDLAEYAEEQHTKWLDVKNHYAGTQLAIANGVNDDLKAKVKELELDVDSCKAMIKVILEDAALTTNKSDKG